MMSLTEFKVPKFLSSTSLEDLDVNELITIQLIHVDKPLGLCHKVLSDGTCCTPTTLVMINFNDIREERIIRVNKHFITKGVKGYIKKKIIVL